MSFANLNRAFHPIGTAAPYTRQLLKAVLKNGRLTALEHHQERSRISSTLASTFTRTRKRNAIDKPDKQTIMVGGHLGLFQTQRFDIRKRSFPGVLREKSDSTSPLLVHVSCSNRQLQSLKRESSSTETISLHTCKEGQL